MNEICPFYTVFNAFLSAIVFSYSLNSIYQKLIIVKMKRKETRLRTREGVYMCVCVCVCVFVCEREREGCVGEKKIRIYR